MTDDAHRVHRLAVEAILVRDDHAYMIAEDTSDADWTTADRIWAFPGGGVHSNEPLDAALRRELREELGIDDCTIAPAPIGTYTYAFPDHTTVYLCYEATFDPPDTLPDDDDAIDHAWLPIDDILTDPAHFDCIQAFLRQHYRK